MSFMYNIAVIGDSDSIYGFGALGLATFPVSDEISAAKIFRELCRGEYAVIYITEKWAELLKEEIEKVRENFIPAVILIPGATGNTRRGENAVREAVIRAVGSDLSFGD